MPDPYPIPAREARAEIVVINSRFIASAGPVFSVDEAKDFVARIRAEFAGATHNVPVYRVGHGASVTEHCGDDGEPSGTAGRPALAVLAGSGIGDVAVVITRYFGGTKLGTGGLVRAYSDAVRAVLAVLPRAQKVPTHTVMLAIPYNWFERAQLLIQQHGGRLRDQAFEVDVTLTAQFPVALFSGFQSALQEASHGALSAEVIETADVIMPLA